jgi:regulator of RNase E activity RraA
MNTNAQPRLSDDELDVLRRVSTATLCSQLLQRGFRDVFIDGVRPLRPDLRLVGHAYTLRYAPAREDVATSVDFDNETNVQRLAVEEVGPHQVLVIDARRDTRAGSLGNILATRLLRRGAAGLVTDGALRDSPGIAALPLPAYAAAANARLSSVIHHPVDRQVPIGCGGALVMPGDVIVGDGDGVVVIPAACAVDVVRAAREQERLESFVLERVEAGATLAGTYPPNAETLAAYRGALGACGDGST